MKVGLVLSVPTFEDAVTPTVPPFTLPDLLVIVNQSAPSEAPVKVGSV